MTRNLQAVALALIALFAAVAFNAQAGTLPHFTAVKGNYPVTLSGESQEPVLTAGENEIHCAKTKLSGTLGAKTTILELTPSVTNPCTASGLPATVTFNKCKFVLQTTEKVESHYNAHANIKCEKAGEAIEIHVYLAADEKTQLCTLVLPAQEKLKSVTLKNNEATTDFSLSGTVEGIAYEEKGVFCPKPGGHKDGKLHIGETGMTISGEEQVHVTDK